MKPGPLLAMRAYSPANKRALCVVLAVAIERNKSLYVHVRAARPAADSRSPSVRLSGVR
jgi:hypothetical protein